MEGVPPHLSDGGQHANAGLSIINDVAAAVIEMEVHGRWSRRLCLDVYMAMRDSLAEQPLAVIVDLRGLNDVDAASTSMWLTASRAAGMLQPPAQLVLCLPPTRQLASHLRRLGAVRFLPMYATMKHAREAVDSRLPSINRLQLSRLSPEPGSAGLAADAVTLACSAWGLPDLAQPGREIMTELTRNALAHAGTDMGLAISLRGTGLHLAVHDRDPRLPSFAAAMRDSVPAARCGLPMVDSHASAWGAVPTREGKVVWAIVRARPRLLR